MSSNHAAVLSALSSSLLGVHAQVNKLQGGFSRLKLAIAGALSVTAGAALFDVMAKIVDKTKDYSDELVKLKQLGGGMLPAVSSGEMSKKAFDIAQRVPMSVTDLLKIPGASYSILGQEDSMKVWESLARFSSVMQFDKDYKGDPGKDLQDLLRASELTGRLTDPHTHKAAVEELQRFLDLSSRVMAATHNMVNPQTLLGMAKQGGFTMRGLSDEGFMTMAMMAQAMGGPRTGTSMMSLWQQFGGGTMRKRTAMGMEDVGLLKPGEWQTDKGGGVILNAEASKRLTGIISKDPLDLAANLLEHFKKTGITDPTEQMRLVMRALGRQTTERFTAEEVTNFQQMLAERGRMRQGLGANSAFGTIMNESVTANLVALQKAWENLLIAVAGPNSENVIAVLQKLTGVINSMIVNINGMNPETLKNIGVGLGILAGALVGGGVIAIAAALGPAGWLAAGLIGLGAAAVAWGPQIQGAMDKVRDFFLNLQSRVLNSIYSMGDAIFNALKSVWDKITALFSAFTKPENKTPTIDDQGLLHYNRFEPGGHQTKPQSISLSLNVDGRTLARAISEQMDALYRYQTSTPAFNGTQRFGA